MCVCIYVSVCIYMGVYIYGCVYMCVCIYVCVYVGGCIYICVCIYMYLCIYLHRAKIKTNISITFLNEPLISVKSVKFLGMILDHSLTTHLYIRI